MSFGKRIKDWLAELDAKGAQADEGDGWHLTEHGRAERDRARQRAEDLRTLIDAATLD